MSKSILEMRNISKTFPGVQALQNVDFTLHAGTIHALMGENGAGKSTLIKVLTGVEEFETGNISINFDGTKKNIINKSPQEAQAKGISTVYQEVNLCPNLTVAENIFAGRQPGRAGLVSWKKINQQATEILKSLDIDIDVRMPLEDCSIAIQQMVAIARAVSFSAKVLILDEPTSSLDDNEVQKLFAVMRRLKNDGIGIIFVTHFLDQMYEICDTVTVLRNGGLVGEYQVSELPIVQLVAKMLGKDLDELEQIKKDNISDKKESMPIVQASKLGKRGSISPFDFDFYPGEVVGIAGLLGSGRSELVRTIYGADIPDSGNLRIKEKRTMIRKPFDSIKRGMGYLPDDRKGEGVLADLSVRENLIIALQAKRGTFRLLSRKEQEKIVDEYIDVLDIKTASRDAPIKQLSGGNQQKVILARWLLTQPEFLILDEPTRGIDVGTKAEIQKLIIKMAHDGMSVVFISSEIDEMLRTSTRMGIMRDRKKVGELEGDQLSQESIMSMIAGGAIDDKES